MSSLLCSILDKHVAGLLEVYAAALRLQSSSGRPGGMCLKRAGDAFTYCAHAA